MIRVFFATSHLQLLFLMAAARSEGAESGESSEDHLLVFGDRFSPAGRDAMVAIARGGRRWASIVWGDALRRDAGSIRRGRFDQAADDIRQILGVDRADELWGCGLGSSVEQAMMAAFPAAAYVLCEDGLSTYGPPPMTLAGALVHPTLIGACLRGVGRRMACLLLAGRRSALHRWPARRIDRAWLFLTDLLGRPGYLAGAAVQAIPVESVRSVIESVRANQPSLTPAAERPGRNVALVLGQYLYLATNTSWDRELAIYTGACERLTAAGYDVVWKEHPKSNRPFAESLKQACPSLHSAPDAWSAWPIEIAAEAMGVTMCVSLSSTALFTLRALYDMPTATVAGELIRLCARRSKRGVLKATGLTVADKHIPSLDTRLR